MSACFCRNFQVILYSANSGSAHRRHVPWKTGCQTAARGPLPRPPTPVGWERACDSGPFTNNKKRYTHSMRTVIQRVSHASVTIDGTVKSSIGHGFLLLLGVEEEDTTEDVNWLVKKVAALRVFDDENGVMNRSILDTGGEALVVSQFTLYASYKKGNRPSWFRAARHEISVPLYEDFCRKLSDALGKPVGTGEFGADMKVELLNDGPVTICMDTKNKE